MIQIKEMTEEQKVFWNKILGEKLYEKLMNNYEQEIIDILIDGVEETQEFLSVWLEADDEIEGKALKDEVFSPFYQLVIQGYLNYVQVKWKEFDSIQNAKKVIVKTLFDSIYHIPLRVCIYDMQVCKRKGELRGDTSCQEYQAYCEKLADKKYAIKLCQEYPEMTRLLYIRMKYAYHNLQRFVERLQRDKEQIEEQLCFGKEFKRIHSIQFGGSDSHKQGQQVIQCLLDNGCRIIYKPHSMNKEMQYQHLYNTFCQKIGLPSYYYKIINRQEYGWEAYLRSKECEREEAVKRYYKRMGIHLFLCYLLRITDMHQENILAMGEFPVVVDVETMPGIAMRQEQENAEESIKSKISTSVLTSGILPTPVWSNGQEGIIISALYCNDEVKSTVKLPVIRKAKTSEMYIDYEFRKVIRTNSIPTYRGEKQYVNAYLDDICEGFYEAYKLFLREKISLDSMIEPIWKERTRYLVRHTQQYSMYLSSSLHPIFLKSSEYRLLMLQVLQKEDIDREIIEQEISAMMKLDIPLLECDAKEELSVYKQSAHRTYMEKVKNLNEKDLQQQLELIRLSVEMMDFMHIQNEYFTSKMKLLESRKTDKAKVKKALNIIIERIMKTSVIEQEDISWQTMKLEGTNLWRMEPATYDFYHGIGGLALFVAEVYKEGYLADDSIYKLLRKKLFRYVDDICCEHREVEVSGQNGLMLGISSVMYTFLLLYQSLEEEVFLSYAKKLVVYLKQSYQQDKEHDLLAGNAGIIIVLSKFYEIIKEEDYRKLAITIGDYLMNNMEEQSVGYGFRGETCKETLSGMAHGNSGFIVAYTELLKNTKDEKYRKVIDELLAYEDSLYDGEIGNWKDLRYAGQNSYANAWCHGAAGILLSRLQLLQLPEYQNSIIVQRDLENAVKVLFSQSMRKGLCICHGMSGNYLIMREYQKYYNLTIEQQEYMEQLKREIVYVVCTDSLLPQDKYMMGFMTGISGIGYTLLQMLSDYVN